VEKALGHDLFFGRAGTALGIDGLIACGIRRAKPLDQARPMRFLSAYA